MRTREIDRIKKKLLELREEIIDEIQHFETNQRDSAKDSAGEVSSFTTHPADMGSVTQEREKAFILADHERRTLAQIDEALERIDNGTYGDCDECGKKINIKRLASLPYAKLCLECKEIEEREAIS